MRLLISEFLCGGGWLESVIPPSLAGEGRAMLLALTADFSKVPGVSVITTWDTRCPAPSFPPELEVHPVRSPFEEQVLLEDLSGSLDAGLVIAPEFNGELARRCRQLRTMEVPLLNCSQAAIDLCTDKLRLAQLCGECGVVTIPTASATVIPNEFPCVVKLRDGAGCLEMQQLKSPADWDQWARREDRERFIVQPVMNGQSCSVGVLFRHGDINTLLPVAEQHLSCEPYFQYKGGRIPALDVDVSVFQPVIERVSSVIPGLDGYVGFDFLLDSQHEPVLVEVNPRVCTSYVGYRQVMSRNLADVWLNGPSGLRLEASGSIVFRADGRREA